MGDLIIFRQKEDAGFNEGEFVQGGSEGNNKN